jgi:hypothetical protein
MASGRSALEKNAGVACAAAFSAAACSTVAASSHRIEFATSLHLPFIVRSYFFR